MSQQEVIDLEKELPGLKQKYEESLRTFLSLPLTHSNKRREGLHTWHATGLQYFNAFERLIALGSLTGADKEPTWYTDKAETAANLLETIEIHYRTVACKADELKQSRDSFKPSMTAFANMQRLVKETHSEIGAKLRDVFVMANLPTHGFDKGRSEKPAVPRIEWRFFIVGAVFLAVALALVVWGFAIGNLTKDQRFLLQWVLPIAGAFMSSSFSGSMSASTNRWAYGLVLAATGGFAVWFVTYLMLQYALPPP